MRYCADAALGVPVMCSCFVCPIMAAVLQDTIDERIASFSKLLEQVQGLDDVECGPLLKFLTDL